MSRNIHRHRHEAANPLRCPAARISCSLRQYRICHGFSRPFFCATWDSAVVLSCSLHVFHSQYQVFMSKWIALRSANAVHVRLEKKGNQAVNLANAVNENNFNHFAEFLENQAIVQVCSSTVSSLDPHQVPINLHVFSSNNHVCWLLASPKPTSPQHPEIPCHQQVQRQGTHCGTSPVKFPQSSNGGVLKIGVPQIHGDFRSF